MVGMAENCQVGGFGADVEVRHKESNRSTADDTVDYSEWCEVGVERTGVQRACNNYHWFLST